MIMCAVYWGLIIYLSTPNRLLDGPMNFWHVRKFGLPIQAFAQLKKQQPQADSTLIVLLFRIAPVVGEKQGTKKRQQAALE